MKKLLCIFYFTCFILSAKSQSIAQIKKILDTTSSPVGYVKFVLKKKFFIDSVTVLSTSRFLGKADSLAYHGKTGKTYGPFKKENILVKVLVKAPNTFYHIKHLLLDTTVFDRNFASSLADSIIEKIRTGRSDFAAQASIYSADLESGAKGGDLGWFVRGVMLPQLDRAMVKHKKGELFKVWSDAGLHIVTVADDPKEDTGYALLLRVLL
ncbi:MAG: peptidylprolyl isomerase [Chitinophagaceae bacterium]|nr:peptidylprolyl isomerase [Chitinophagaceae bacterium]